ncbi:hypothetical protein E3N88_00178 [Mikania micrantha]|uniref:Uncharacterized protein n=1 Tax=Mikania micrantha TaxID=192012 RepID=A0A5N6PXS5_9ASTR|nr:hypothetical protein E3N88_00178 [Mikania micrantha]
MVVSMIYLGQMGIGIGCTLFFQVVGVCGQDKSNINQVGILMGCWLHIHSMELHENIVEHMCNTDWSAKDDPKMENVLQDQLVWMMHHKIWKKHGVTWTSKLKSKEPEHMMINEVKERCIGDYMMIENGKNEDFGPNGRLNGVRMKK